MMLQKTFCIWLLYPLFLPPCRVAALGLAAGVLLVLLLFCLYRVLCPRNYGQNGVPHGRRRRGDLPCDDYGYSPPISEISPLLLRGHSMVRRSVHLDNWKQEFTVTIKDSWTGIKKIVVATDFKMMRKPSINFKTPFCSFCSCSVFPPCRTSSVWPVTGCCWRAVAWQDRFGFGTPRLVTVWPSSQTTGENLTI